MLKKSIIYLLIIFNFTALSANQPQNISSLSSRSSIDKELEQDCQRKDRRGAGGNERLGGADQRGEGEEKGFAQETLPRTKRLNRDVLLRVQHAVQGYLYFVCNHQALIDNYKKTLHKHTIELRGKSYTLLALMRKFGHSSTDRQHYRAEEKGKEYHDIKVAFYIGKEKLELQCLDIIALYIKIQDIIADEMKKPSSKTKKAKKAFNYLKKKAKKNHQAINYDDSVILMLAFFHSKYENVAFEHTQTQAFVLSYNSLIKLYKDVKAYQKKVNTSKRAKSIQS